MPSLLCLCCPIYRNQSWNGPRSPLLVRELKGHTAQVTAVAFSGDHRFVATGSEDGTVRLTSL